MSPAPHASALAGLRVIDFSNMIAGPYCTRWLCDLGADVVKVEAPEGDHMRHRAPERGGHSAYFGHLNSGKRSIVLNLKEPRAADLARQLTDDADVVVEAFRPGVMNRLGLGALALCERNPRLIYCAISGFGQSTDLSARPAYAPIVHAASGFDWAQGMDEQGRSIGSAIPMADILTAIFAVMAIQHALLERHITGRGTVIDVNLMDSVLSALPYEFQAGQLPAEQARPKYGPLRTNDGFVLVTPINARNFRNLCEALGRPEWAEDPLLATDAARFQNWAEYMRRIEAWTLQRSAAQCESILSHHGVPCTRYKRIAEAMKEPQFSQRESFSSVSDGPYEYLTTRLPFAFEGVRPKPGARVPGLGADTAEVLRERCGLSPSQIDSIAATGAITCHPT